ncbi:LysR family transcriptional regulator [Gulosibacter sediminis]|uniref:LysR family transcriptional regulator n=1 Tax=Gulosibacter sediminis TaxID=1729695 RepID=UPI0024A9B10B|nr:LysR family transcriptional regulator [Gulosibacter sediminis]
MSDFTLRQLEYLVAVAEHGTIAAAAASLHVSESAVATALTQLERSLGTTLLVRRRAHGVQLTSEGTLAVQRARSLLVQTQDFQAEFSSVELRGSVHIATYPTLAPTLAPRLVRKLEDAHPGLRVQVSTMPASRLQQEVEHGQVDLGICYGFDLAGDFERRVLRQLHAHVALPPDHRLADAERVDLRELADEPFIRYDQSPSWEHTQSVLEAAGISVNTRFSTDGYELARSYVAAGLGWSLFVMRSLNEGTRDGGHIVVKPISPPPTPTEVVAVWRRNRPMRRVQPLIDALVALVQEDARTLPELG